MDIKNSCKAYIFFKVKKIAAMILKIRKLMKNIHLFFSNTSYKLQQSLV